MSYRFLTIALTAASVLLATHTYAETTVKSSKSNTSDRMGGGGGAKTTTVKSSKSNTSDRMGGGGGGKGAAGKAINLNSSRSNKF